MMARLLNKVLQTVSAPAQNAWVGRSDQMLRHGHSPRRPSLVNERQYPLMHSCHTGKHIHGLSHRDDQPYIPPTVPYELSSLVVDLVLLARYLLKPRGRLVFFLPTVTDEYEELDIDTMLCDGMEVVANSLQNFGSWGRRVCLSAVVFLRVGHLIMSRGLCSSSPYGKRLMSSICLLHSHRRLTSPIVCKRTHLRIRISGKSISSG